MSYCENCGKEITETSKFCKFCGFELSNKKELKVYPNGHIYEGKLINEKRTGVGKLKLSNGDVYEGEFWDDKKIKGKYTYISGNIYEGEFLNGKMSGQGKYNWLNGNIYVGDW